MKNGFKLRNSLSFYIKSFLLWLGLSITVGILCGLLGGLFAKSISFVTAVRLQNEKLIFLLPALSLLSVALFKLCRVSDVGTNQIFKAAKTERKVPLLEVVLLRTVKKEAQKFVLPFNFVSYRNKQRKCTSYFPIT